MIDEPLVEPKWPAEGTLAEHPELADKIAWLVREQPYAVLCTQGQGQPYGSLVAFAANDDLASIVFATPISTRKYRLLSACDCVAMVIDSRLGSSADMMSIEVLTATGRAAQVPAGPEFARWSELLIRRHPQLEGFVKSPATALFLVDIVRYIHVSHFQEVRQWAPPRG